MDRTETTRTLKTPRRTWRANVLLAAFSAVTTLALAELAAQIYVTRFAEENVFLRYGSLRQLDVAGKGNPWPNRKYSPHRYLGYFPTPNWQRGEDRHNSLGYRGEEIELPKPDGEYRIVCQGGSTTYSSSVNDFRKTYPYLLQEELRARGHENVTVVNAGADGWSSHETLINFALRVVDLSPDLIVVYDGINDVHSRLVSPVSAYTGDNRGWKEPMYSALTMPPWYEHSTLARIVLIDTGRALPHAGLDATINPRAITSLEMDLRDQWAAGTYPSPPFDMVSVNDILDRNPPVYFKRNLEELTAMATSRGVEVMLATITYSPEFPKEVVVASPDYQRAYTEHNAVIREVADSTPAHLFDFASVFPNKREYFVDGRHLTEEGLRIKARTFADAIVEVGMLDR